MGLEDDYQRLRRQPPAERRAWLRLHGPGRPRGNWWWAMLDRAHADVQSIGGNDGTAFAVDLVDMASVDGMPGFLGASWIARLSRGATRDDVEGSTLPDVLQPNSVARRILNSFQLSRSEALDAAAYRRQELLNDERAWRKPGEPIGELVDGDVDKSNFERSSISCQTWRS
jgi:hypothetical protein